MSSPREILRRTDIRAKKSLGQHFLSDPGLAEKIAAALDIEPDDIVLEIGPGLGALTFCLARKAAGVWAVEKDRRMMGILKAELGAGGVDNVRLVEGDFLKFDISGLSAAEGRSLKVAGNLPYNISSQVLARLAESRQVISGAVLMFQKELARRVMAKPGTKDYGRLSVALAYCADIRRVARAGSKSFFPRPKVDSEVLRVDFKTPDFPARDEIFFKSVVKAAFSSRRKTLKNALAGSHLSIEAAGAIQALGRAGVDPVRRAETLSVEEFVRLADVLNDAAEYPAPRTGERTQKEASQSPRKNRRRHGDR
ncbi:Ribosomal RNA small subunit methyltransferase A [Candidatus Desulfarcum epimagneticum]|uniref:Ribosomal RNA small subunit methyltransferase A n=1 Tax=uncultured Desulfobacteraceae bacterium TaxID=218296 RepID=A0A484HD27_9BACT|nr:Ribosomal RNA small subunit methyltransferase A [uncultured Desulfobacteraceae bacterium]